MTNVDKIRDEKQQYDINRGAAKILALSSGKTDKYEYLAGEAILHLDQRIVIKQAKITYSTLDKACKKQKKRLNIKKKSKQKIMKMIK